MDITDMKRGERALVSLVSCSPALKERLRTLNVRAGGVVRLLKVSFFKKTYLLSAGGTKLAVRREVAKCILIRKV